MARQTSAYVPLTQYLEANAPGVQRMVSSAMQGYKPSEYTVPTEVTGEMMEKYGTPGDNPNLQTQAAGAAYPEILGQTPSEQDIYSRAIADIAQRGTAGERRLNLALLGGSRPAITGAGSASETAARQAALGGLSGLIVGARTAQPAASSLTAAPATVGAGGITPYGDEVAQLTPQQIMDRDQARLRGAGLLTSEGYDPQAAYQAVTGSGLMSTIGMIQLDDPMLGVLGNPVLTRAALESEQQRRMGERSYTATEANKAPPEGEPSLPFSPWTGTPWSGTKTPPPAAPPAEVLAQPLNPWSTPTPPAITQSPLAGLAPASSALPASNIPVMPIVTTKKKRR